LLLSFFVFFDEKLSFFVEERTIRRTATAIPFSFHLPSTQRRPRFTQRNGVEEAATWACTPGM
jgi:hypothetical protein